MWPWRGLVRTHYFESTVSQNPPTTMNSSKLASFADHISTDTFSVTLTSSRLVCQGQSLQVKWLVQVQNRTVSDNETVAMVTRTMWQVAERRARQKIVAKGTALYRSRLTRLSKCPQDCKVSCWRRLYAWHNPSKCSNYPELNTAIT